MRRTKIVCTIGPASRSAESIENLILAGMNVARLNFSHETWKIHGGASTAPPSPTRTFPGRSAPATVSS